jgi:undecaprenyl-diphosphatase
MSRVRDRLRLTARGWHLLQIAAVAALGAITVLGVVGEDVTQHNGLSTTDPAHLRFFVDHRPHLLVSLARAVTDAGTVPVLLGLSLIAGAALWWRGQRVMVAVAPAVALLATGAVVAVTKDVVGRTRPDLAVRLVSDNEASFPSGHSADSAALFVTLAIVVAAFVLRRPLARAATVCAGLAVSGAIGLSRLVLAAHWPTDVLAGWALGLLVALVVGTTVVLVSHLATTPARGTRLSDRLVVRLLSRRETADISVADATTI